MFFFKETNYLTFNPKSIEHAYMAILSDDLNSAEKVFLSIESPRALWGVSLTQILKGFVENFPTYFGIRNFLEIDTDFLLKNKKLDYVESILGSLQFLSNINQEVYKYAGRVMYENGLYNAAKEYFDKSKKIFYKDPELHFLLAKYYIKNNDYTPADFHLDECLKIVPKYYPATILKAEIAKYLA